MRTTTNYSIKEVIDAHKVVAGYNERTCDYCGGPETPEEIASVYLQYNLNEGVGDKNVINDAFSMKMKA